MNWQEGKQFSKQSKQRNVQELYKFYSWLKLIEQSIESVNSLILKQYIKYRAFSYKSSTKNRIIQYLQPFLFFYKENINPNYNIPSYIIQSGKSPEIYTNLCNSDVKKIQSTVIRDFAHSEPALMLYLVLEYGIPFKSLAVLKFNKEHNSLDYIYQNSSRLGIENKSIFVINNNKLIDILQSKSNSYIFNTRHSRRRNKPVSSIYIRTSLDNYTKQVIGFKLPIQSIYRGYLRYQARDISLPKYFELTKYSPLSKKTKLYCWLSASYSSLIS